MPLGRPPISLLEKGALGPHFSAWIKKTILNGYCIIWVETTFTAAENKKGAFPE
jgi:hypothetical protein